MASAFLSAVGVGGGYSQDSILDQIYNDTKRDKFGPAEELIALHKATLSSISSRKAQDWLRTALASPKHHSQLIAVVGNGLAGNPSLSSDDKKLLVQAATVMVTKGHYPALQHKASMNCYRGLVNAACRVYRDAGQFSEGLQLLKEGFTIFRALVKEYHLTPFHANYVDLCIAWGNPSAALWLMDTPVYQVEPPLSGVTAVDFMAYFYYCGIALIAMGKFQRAYDSLRNVLCVPAMTPSVVMVLAYKALTLVSLLNDGVLVGNVFPPHMNSMDERLIKQHAEPYSLLAERIEAGEAEEAAMLQQQYAATFQSDVLDGLVAQTLAAAPRIAILGLTRVYVTLTLTQIEERVNVRNVEPILVSMISRGEIGATIDRSKGNVAFEQRSVPSEADIEEQMQRVERLSVCIRDIDDRLIGTPEHVKAKLRMAPNLREILADYDRQRKAQAGVMDSLNDFVGSGRRNY